MNQGAFNTVGVFSRKLFRIPHLAAFLGAGRVVWIPGAWRTGGLDAVAGWGSKPTADRARSFAEGHGLPFLSIEDGFLRSLGLGATGAAPLSLVVDDLGLYYDASRPSRLEALLNHPGEFTAADLALAGRAIRLVREHRLSKYNAAPEPVSLPESGRPRVLVVDQTRGDRSVLLGGASEATFQRMLEAALDENPGAEIIVKAHPDTLAGRKSGYLAGTVLPAGVRLIDGDINPHGILERCDRVYTVTSQLGFEALLAGLPVDCFGMPFYAGWGVTRDRIECPRRRHGRTVVEIFAAAYIQYARYVDPLTGGPCDILRIIELLAGARRLNEANRGTTVCLGMQRWKRRHLRPFLASTGGRTIFARNATAAIRKGAARGSRILVWGDKNPPGLDELVAHTGGPVGRVEDGFLRSVGLGSDFVPPGSLAIDWRGIHYDPSRPSDLETLLGTARFPPDLLARAARLRREIIDSGLSKYNVGKPVLRRPDGAAGRRILLVPGQIEDDASVRRGCADIRTNLALVEAVRHAEPDGYIIYKPHPDAESRNRDGGACLPAIAALCDAVWSSANIHDCLALADEVHTMTSLAGFEALLRGLPVVTWGGPFYAGWGLTRDRMDFPRRGRRLTLDELIAGSLMLYPRYHDWRAGMPCDCESTIRQLASRRAGRGMPVPARPLLRPDRAARRFGRYIAGWVHA